MILHVGEEPLCPGLDFPVMDPKLDQRPPLLNGSRCLKGVDCPLSHTGHLEIIIYCCCCLVTQLCPTLCDPMDCNTPGFPVFHHLLELAQTHSTESVMPSNHLILCHRLLLFPSIFPKSGSIPSGTGLRMPDPRAPHPGPGGNPQHRGPSEGPVRCKSSWELQAQGQNLQ